MQLIAQVTGTNEVKRGESEDIVVQFKLVSSDPNVNADGSQMALILPRVLGSRYTIGENFPLELQNEH